MSLEERLFFMKKISIYVVVILLVLSVIFVTVLYNKSTNKEDMMVSLHIDFQTGFSNDTVIVQIDGHEIFRKNNVNTDYSLGLADSADTQVTRGTVNIKVTVPTRNVSDSFSLEISKTAYLGISIIDERIEYQFSDEMFEYF